MPEQTHQPIITEASKQSAEKSASQKAKNQLLEEISKITTQSADHMVIKEAEFSAEQMHFSVSNPTKISSKVGSIIKYSVIGMDKEGRFEAQRRFNEFYTLRKTLNERWPGCYIPCIPEKSAINIDVSKSNPLEWSLAGNKDGIFIEERRTLLERFLRELARYDFIIESKEFKIFSRGSGEIDEVL